MIVEAFRLAIREISRNIMRSGLTTLGIVIGVAAVIAMVTLGGGAQEKVTGDIANLGKNLLVVAPGSGQNGPRSSAPPFKMSDAEAIRRNVTGVEAVAPFGSSSVIAVYGNENWKTQINGVNNDYFFVRSWQLAAGRMFDEGEERAGRMVCVIGESVRKELFGGQDPLGAKIRLSKGTCTVIGLLAPKGQSSFGQDQDNAILVPLAAFQRRVSGNTDVSILFVSARDGVDTTRVKEAVEALMRQRRHIPANQPDDFEVNDLKEIAKIVETTTGILTALLGAIAAISLIVGGIGIMNIMLVSVTERTREIGIRLAIGALEREVLTQFLVEAATLSFLGGFLGILLGLGISALASPALTIPFVLNVPIILVAFLFSGAVGLVFGFFPARRAARLDPIEALRYE
ncbi:MAG: FtsX-like permease family protein [Rhizobiales bacterium]|nr:FtsX-like permease family protein [Hyphomicrobiales bacterium]